MRFGYPLLLALALTACGDKNTGQEDFTTSNLTLPSGKIVRIETMIDTRDLLRGMAFRTSIADNEGMLFVHKTPGKYSFWMYQHVIPLDMMFLDDNHRIVEIVENAQPCKTVASKCERFGGAKEAKYGFEMGAGMVKKYGLKIGDMLQW